MADSDVFGRFLSSDLDVAAPLSIEVFLLTETTLLRVEGGGGAVAADPCSRTLTP